jgi:hypothetical protein
MRGADTVVRRLARAGGGPAAAADDFAGSDEDDSDPDEEDSESLGASERVGLRRRDLEAGERCAGLRLLPRAGPAVTFPLPGAVLNGLGENERPRPRLARAGARGLMIRGLPLALTKDVGCPVAERSWWVEVLPAMSA